MSHEKGQTKNRILSSALTVFSAVMFFLIAVAWFQWGTREGPAELDQISHEKGFAYFGQAVPLVEKHAVLGIPFKIKYKLRNSDSVSSSSSKLELYEDGDALGPAHSLHDDIRHLGRGRFSHWNTAVYFSASDNSDPKENGRNYTIQAQWVMTGKIKKIMFVLLVIFFQLVFHRPLSGMYRHGSDRPEALWISVGVPALVAVMAHLILFFSSPMWVNADSGTYLNFSNIRGPGLGWLAHAAWFLGGSVGQLLIWHGMALASVILAGLCAFTLMRSHLAAFLVTLLVGLGTEQYVYSSILTSETPVMFFSMLFLTLFLGYLKSGKQPFLYASLLTATYATLLRTENILLFGIVISLAIVKIWQERNSSQTRVKHFLYLAAAVIIAFIPLQFRCFQMYHLGHGWRLNQPGYEAVAYYDGAIVNASDAGKREMINVRNPYMEMIRESVWRNTSDSSTIDYPFTANCWYDIAALIHGMKLKVEEADRTLLKATQNFYLQDPLWSVQFIGYKVWMANELHPVFPTRGLAENELPESLHSAYESMRDNVNKNLRQLGYSMQIGDRYYGSQMWLRLHDAFFEIIQRAQSLLAVFPGYFPLIFLGFLLSLFRREKLVWLAVSGLFFLRCLLIPTISFALTRTVAPGYPVAMLLGIGAIHMGFDSIRHWSRLWNDFKVPSNQRSLLISTGFLMLCLVSIYAVAQYQVPKVIDRKVQMVSGQPMVLLELASVSNKDIKQITLIDWRHRKRWTTEEKTLLVETSQQDENQRELGRGQIMLALKPLSEVEMQKQKQSTYEIEIELTSGKILWDYVMLPFFYDEKT